jgi:hypothetical protein
VKYLDGFQIILEAFGTFFLVVVLTSLQKFSVEFKSGPQDANIVTWFCRKEMFPKVYSYSIPTPMSSSLMVENEKILHCCTKV